MMHPVKRVIVGDMTYSGHAYPINGDDLQTALATDQNTPSAGNLWTAPGVHSAAPVTHRHMVRTSERINNMVNALGGSPRYRHRVSASIIAGGIF